MYLQYNNVYLRVIDIQRFERMAVYTPDNVDLLYLRTTLGVSTEFSPGGMPKLTSVTELSPDNADKLKGDDNTAWSLAATPWGALYSNTGVKLEDDVGGNSPSAPSTWRSGAETDSEITSRLMVPRRPLILWAYDRQTGAPIRWLESPRPSMVVDATTGPTPLSCDVISVKGEPNAVGIYFQIQTDVSPCPKGTDRFVLSHRWTMSHTYDRDYYLTRVTSGEIVFHAGVREVIKTNPDSVRNQFILPIPVGFRREIREVTQSPDGCTIRYVVADTDPTVCFSPGDSGATFMSIVESSVFSSPILPGVTTGGPRAPGHGTPIFGSQKAGDLIDRYEDALDGTWAGRLLLPQGKGSVRSGLKLGRFGKEGE